MIKIGINVLLRPEIPDFLTDEECEHVISLAKATGLSSSKIGSGSQEYEKGLDKIMKEAGGYACIF